ncbi:hypothetical protein [Agromyces larvae]|uniref:HNH endonuclease n=1 Tax=Agromyces larvae TaxID=2929802 RepID=A0ABY4C223_9MICO|nr:hypothetical protein [Agromyces larvae]UOE45487.1 hypothetical protein MTO99_06940 [Agromyces larvae]
MSSHHKQTRRFKQLKADFRAECEATDAPCWMDGMPIDYTVPDGTTDDSFENDHYYPVSTHPELREDPANFRPSHSLCNRQRGNGSPLPPLGLLSRAWA